MSKGRDPKKLKMESMLNQLKQWTVVVADTGNFKGKYLRETFTIKTINST